MIDKVKKILTIILIAFVVIGIVFALVKVIINIFKGVDIITPEEVSLYTVESNIQSNYGTFYYIDSCIKNIFESCNRGKYDEVLNLYIDDYRGQMKDSEKKDILKKVTEQVIEKDGENIKYNYIFEKLYNANKKYNEYIAEITIGEDRYYLLITLEDGREYSYKFAFLK